MPQLLHLVKFYYELIAKNRPLWKQGSQPKLTAYEKINYLF